MDEKSQSDARRRKILENAEARLRFIKEGIPWRNNDEPVEKLSDSDVSKMIVEDPVLRHGEEQSIESPNDRLEPQVTPATDSESPSIDPVQCSLRNSDNKDMNSVSELKDESRNSESSVLQEDNLTEFNTTKSECNIDPLEQISTVKNFQLPVELSENLRETLRENLRETLSLPNRSNDIGTRTDDPLKVLMSLLNESSNERQEHKRKTQEMNQFLWMSCSIMLFLGVFTRISYYIGLSWLFNEIMLVPFVTGVIPCLASLLKDPPSPSGTLARVLVMAKIKISVVKNTFIVITVLRTFFQLFSVYLISFVFTHQLAESFG